MKPCDIEGFYCYIIECIDGSYYTGWTTNLLKRYLAHCEGKGAKYTKSHPPKALYYYEECSNKKDACIREYEIKQLSHNQKKKLGEIGLH